MSVQYAARPRGAPNGPCELCERAAGKFVTDHCHAHGWIRGVLCPQCNATVGHADRGRAVRRRGGRGNLGAWRARCPDCAPIAITEHDGDYANLRVRPVAAADLRRMCRQLAARLDREVTQSDALGAAVALALGNVPDLAALVPPAAQAAEASSVVTGALVGAGK